MTTFNGKYFPKPTFVNVRDDGSIGLEWSTKDARLFIEFDNSKDIGEGESNMYAGYVARDGNKREFKHEHIWIHSPSDVLRAIELLGLKAE